MKEREHSTVAFVALAGLTATMACNASKDEHQGPSAGAGAPQTTGTAGDAGAGAGNAESAAGQNDGSQTSSDAGAPGTLPPAGSGGHGAIGGTGAGGMNGANTVRGHLGDIAGPKVDQKPVLLSATHLGDQGSAYSIFVDSNDDLLVVAASGAHKLTAVTKYDSHLSKQWTNSTLAPTNATTEAAAFNAAGETFVGGSTTAALPGEVAVGGRDAFVGKIDPDGRPVWMHQWGSTSTESSQYLASGPDGSVLASGPCGGTAPGAPMPSPGSPFAARYESDGSRTWIAQPAARGFGVSGSDNSNITVSTSGTTYQSYRNLLRTVTATGDKITDTPVADPMGTAVTMGMLNLDASDSSLYAVAFTGLYKLSLDGSALWWRQFGSQSATIDSAAGVVWKGGFGGVSAMAIASDGFYLMGPYTNAYQNLKPAQPTRIATYVGRYDLEGNQIWFQEFLFSPAGTDQQPIAPLSAGGGIALTSDGNPIVVLNGIVSSTVVWYAFKLQSSDGVLL